MKNVLTRLGFCVLLIGLSLSTLTAQSAGDTRLEGQWILESLELQLLASDGTVTSTNSVSLSDTAQLKSIDALLFLNIFDSNMGVKSASGNIDIPINDKGSFLIDNGQLVITLNRMGGAVSYRFDYRIDGNRLTLAQVGISGSSKKYTGTYRKQK